jgi:hypothetical protein
MDSTALGPFCKITELTQQAKCQPLRGDMAAIRKITEMINKILFG